MFYKIVKPKQVAARIRSKMSAAGTKPTVRNMAPAMKIKSPATVIKVTKGRPIDWDTASKVADFLGCSVSDIASEVS